MPTTLDALQMEAHELQRRMDEIAVRLSQDVCQVMCCGRRYWLMPGEAGVCHRCGKLPEKVARSGWYGYGMFECPQCHWNFISDAANCTVGMSERFCPNPRPLAILEGAMCHAKVPAQRVGPLWLCRAFKTFHTLMRQHKRVSEAAQALRWREIYQPSSFAATGEPDAAASAAATPPDSDSTAAVGSEPPQQKRTRHRHRQRRPRWKN